MKVRVENVRAAAQKAVDHVRAHRAKLKKEHDDEIAELHKSWWGRWFTEENQWDDEYNWYGFKDLNMGLDFLKALEVVAEDTIELTTKEAVFVSRWVDK